MLEKRDAFLEALRERVLIEPRPGFDTRFRARFEAEFPSTAAAPLGRILGIPRAWAALGAAAAIALAVGSLVFHEAGQRAREQAEIAAAAAPLQILDQEELFANLDMFERLDDIDMPDADWDVLLNGDGDGGGGNDHS